MALLCLTSLAACDGETGTSDAAMSDGGSGGICDGMGDPVPMVDPSNREVRFHITGPMAAYVVTQGTQCAPFGVDDLRLALPFNCGCSCFREGPRLSGPMIADGTTLTWNAERLATYSACIDCSSGMTGSEVRAVGQAAAPGMHTLRLLVADTVPSGCSGNSGFGLSCDTPPSPAGELVMTGDGSLCARAGLRQVDIEFELPATGEVDIDVVVPPPT